MSQAITAATTVQGVARKEIACSEVTWRPPFCAADAAGTTPLQIQSQRASLQHTSAKFRGPATSRYPPDHRRDQNRRLETIQPRDCPKVRPAGPRLRRG